MIPQSEIQELWAAARHVKPSAQTPYAFERRVMAAVLDAKARETGQWTGSGLWSAVLVSVAVAVVAMGLDFAVQDPSGEADVEETLEWAILPTDAIDPGF